MNHLTFSSVVAVAEMPDVEVEKVRSIFDTNENFLMIGYLYHEGS
jgi:hypothetical protein